MSRLGRELIVPTLVVVEADRLLRARVSPAAARAFLAALAAGEHTVAFGTRRLLRRAAALDARFGGLELGLAKGMVMALAEHHDLPILTFDFDHFRATRPASGFWRLIVDESRYVEATRSGLTGGST